MNDDLRDLFARTIASPPPSTLDVEAAIRRGRRQQAHRRQVVIGTVAAGALAAASAVAAVTGEERRDPPQPSGTVGATEPGGGLPDAVAVTCSTSGITLSSSSIKTRPGGVAFVVSSSLPRGSFLSVRPLDGETGSAGGEELPEQSTTWVLQYVPGTSYVLSCDLAGSQESVGTATVRVSDPDGHYRGRGAIDALGCAGGELADWIAPLFQVGATPREAATKVAEAFRALPGNAEAAFTVTRPEVGYRDPPNQTWLVSRDGEPYVTVLVNPDGDRFSAGPNDRCRGFG